MAYKYIGVSIMDSLGGYLKKEREARGVTVDEVCNTTRITRPFILAIEENNFDVIPGETFIVGFLRSYAKVIGVNGDEVVDKYYAYTKKTESDLPVREEEESGEGIGRRNLFLAFFVLFLLIGSYFFSKDSGQETVKSEKVAIEELTNEMAPAVTNDIPETEVISDGMKIEGNDKVKNPIEDKKTTQKKELLTVKANEDAWIHVVIDGDVVKDILLKKGEHMNYKAKERFLFTTGNLKGIEVLHNGDKVSFPIKGRKILKDFLITSKKK